MASELKAIETQYKGYRFRSRLEARWAVFFDDLDIEWEYEKEGYDLGEAGWYLPDFWLPERRVFVEIKPGDAPDEPLLYLAGKCSGDWRYGLDTKGAHVVGPWIRNKHDDIVHATGTYDWKLATILRDDLCALDMADIVFAWINSFDCYGTLAELGYAYARETPIWIAFDEKLKLPSRKNPSDPEKRKGVSGTHELWFVAQMARNLGAFPNPQAALTTWLPPLGQEEAKVRALLDLPDINRAAVVYGTPDLTQNQCILFQQCLGQVTREAIPIHSVFCPNGHERATDGASFHRIMQEKDALLEHAAMAARSARFEYGECGAPGGK